MKTLQYHHIDDFGIDLSEVYWKSFSFGDAVMTLVSAGEVRYELECNEVDIPSALESLCPETLIAFDG